MKRPSEKMTRENEKLKELMGLGARSSKKSYYPELQHKVEELQREKERYERIFHAARNGIFQTNLKGRVIIANPAIAKICGYPSPETFISQIKDIGEDLFENSLEKKRIIEKLRKEESVPTYETKIKRVNEKNRCVLLSARIDKGPEGEVIEFFVEDITERKRSHEIMVQTEKMMSVGGLAAGMAHEIKNPLAGILQNIQVIKNRTIADLPKNIKTADEIGISFKTIQEYLIKRDVAMMIETVINSAKRADQIIENMLSFSRKSEGEFDLHNIGDLLDRTIEIAKTDFSLKRMYNFKDIEIIREYDSSAPKISCEGSKIQQVFLNILKNGTEAMAEASVEKPCFILRILKESNFVRVEIEDNGPGMDNQTRKRVFEPFFTTKKKGEGTGLGLSVSYFIITDNHKGSMEVDSTPGCGAKFIIRLPLP